MLGYRCVRELYSAGLQVWWNFTMLGYRCGGTLQCWVTGVAGNFTVLAVSLGYAIKLYIYIDTKYNNLIAVCALASKSYRLLAYLHCQIVRNIYR